MEKLLYSTLRSVIRNPSNQESEATVTYPIYRHDDGGSEHLWNVGAFQRD
jgi:hypothetical protein